MDMNRKKPDKTCKFGRFGLSRWKGRKPVEVPAEMKGMLTENRLCLQYSYKANQRWVNHSIWFKAEELDHLIQCIALFKGCGQPENSLAKEQIDENAAEEEQAQDIEGHDPVDTKPGPPKKDLEAMFLTGGVIRAIERIKAMNHLIPGHGVWWSQEDINLDLDAILTQYGMNTAQFNNEEVLMLRRMLAIMCEKAKQQWGPEDLRSYADMALAS